MFNRNLLVFPLILVAFTIVFSIGVKASAENSDAQSLEDKISEYQEKLDKLSNKQKTLANEIEIMNGQINLTELRIQNSTEKINKTTIELSRLVGDIEDISKRIVKIQESIEYQRNALNIRMRERYKSKEDSPLVVVFGADSINQLLKKTEYLLVMERQDHKLLSEMDRTKTTFNKQKQIFEDKKNETEDLKNRLEVEKSQLDGYKATLVDQQLEKKRLLEVTQNDENKYQKLLAEAQRELAQITGAVGVLKNHTARKVDKGELIGIQGNTGYSRGDHLHFGVYKYESFTEIDGWNWYYSNYVDPDKVLKSKRVYWDTGCENEGYRTVGNGDWSWPLSSPTVSQGFGKTCWSNIYYGGKPHPAYDMWGSYGSSVSAAEDGDAYFCRNCLGDGGNGVFIFHDDGYMTVYWHLR